MKIVWSLHVRLNTGDGIALKWWLCRSTPVDGPRGDPFVTVILYTIILLVHPPFSPPHSVSLSSPSSSPPPHLLFLSSSHLPFLRSHFVLFYPRLLFSSLRSPHLYLIPPSLHPRSPRFSALINLLSGTIVLSPLQPSASIQLLLSDNIPSTSASPISSISPPPLSHYLHLEEYLKSPA